MKREPTAETAVMIYHLVNIELNDLEADYADQHFNYSDQLRDQTEKIQDELDTVAFLVAETAGVGRNPKPDHTEMTEIYRCAEQIAGMAIRLAAIARSDIIRSEE